ncbi:MAG: ATP-dependent DNA helicase RecG [Lachnospiraceae bacterium]|nr:ATP-dependent DNA helicase RecG [Lachnospiraceae bacterium]
MVLEDNVNLVKGVGEKTAKTLQKLDIYNVEDLLRYYPRQYDFYGEIREISGLSEGDVAVIECSLEKRPQVFNSGRYRILTISVRDKTGRIFVTWFNMPFLAKILKVGKKYLIRGKVGRSKYGRTILHPQILSENEYYNNKYNFMPIYPLTKGITSKTISKYVREALKTTTLTESLSSDLLKKYDLISLKNALQRIHFPKDDEEYKQARKRLVFEEFYDFLSRIKELKKEKKKIKSEYNYEKSDLTERFINELPYQLTEGQKNAINDIKNDLKDGTLIARMIQGDVGCGKTVVAMAAMLLSVENGYQSAIMVPTTVLARQHFNNISNALEKYGLKVVLLDGGMKVKEKREAYEMISSGEADIVVGTHALIQEAVEFKNLSLVITDEQHRFGVRQKNSLKGKGEKVHMIVMSATPIPRSLALVLYGDLDISLIDVLPSGRKPIKNCLVDTSYREKAYQFIEKQVRESHQAYVICPMVEESETMDAENVIDYTKMLKERLPKDIVVEYVHGKMKNAEKEEILLDFYAGHIQVLVSTTVIEVGIDVPNATVMLIENSERFGLATLHQLRGRIGRSDLTSYCIFMTSGGSKETMDRLKIISESNDGFKIANEDLKTRGPGDIFGIRQSGEIGFRLADIYSDTNLLKMAYQALQ